MKSKLVFTAKQAKRLVGLLAQDFARATFEEEQRQHILHGGWKCIYCGYDGQDNQRGNRFCSRCHIHI